jgi:hypothetical protein
MRFAGFPGVLKLLTVLTLPVALCLAQITSASAATVFDVRIPATSVFPSVSNPCTTPADTVTVTGGIAHLHLEMTTDSNGGMHADINGNLEGVTGVGAPSGDNYQITAWFHVNVQLNSSGTTVFSDGDVFHVISKSSSANFDFSGVVHFTVTANGDLTAVVTDIRPTCHG